MLRLLILSLIVAAPSAALAEARNENLLAHGAEDRFWIAQYVPKSASQPDVPPHTVVYVRGAGDSSFFRFREAGGHILALAHRGEQLGLLLEGGEWVMASDAGTSSEGPPLPGGAQVIDLAGGDDTFWAIGTGGVIPAPATVPTEPSTAPTTNAAPATTQSVAFPPSLFRLDDGVWKSLGPIPRAATIGVERSSLAIIDHVPCLAFVDGTRVVRVVQFDGSEWRTVALLSSDAPVTTARLLRGTSRLVVWIAREHAADTLDFFSGATPARHVALSFVPASADSVAVACALGRIRVLFSSGASVSEQDLDVADGSIAGTVTKISFPAEVPVSGIVRVMQYVVWTALFVAILGAMRWRRRMQGMTFDLEKMHIAPLARRASAGLIDLFPFIIGIAVFEQPLSSQSREIVMAASIGVYLLHTALGEMLTCRTLGKWLLGMRVVSLTGQRPPLISLLLRNVLRVIDVGLGFVPLVVVILSPLRQRTGDVAAGTLVVRSDEPLPR